MTQVVISEIQITSSQIIVQLNGSTRYFELFDLSNILKEITEKTIVVKSRGFNEHNDYEAFRNNFMFRLNQLLHNANYNRQYDIERNNPAKEYKITVPYWLIDKIESIKDKSENKTYIQVTIRNIMNEKLEDN